MPDPTLTYTCHCGTPHVLRIIAHENPPIPYRAWPDDSWYIRDVEPGNEEVDSCRECGNDLPVLLYNIDRGNVPTRFALTYGARTLIEKGRPL